LFESKNASPRINAIPSNPENLSIADKEKKILECFTKVPFRYSISRLRIF